MNNIIPEDEYQKILKSMPIFCIDFLIRCEKKYLLIKRTQEPLKGDYWIIGGRLRFKETVEDLAIRIQTREVGRYFPNRKLIGFSNYFFPEVPEARATHTPAILYLVDVYEMFEPKIDETHSDFVWSEELPIELKKQTNFINDFSLD